MLQSLFLIALKLQLLRQEDSVDHEGYMVTSEQGGDGGGGLVAAGEVH